MEGSVEMGHHSLLVHNHSKSEPFHIRVFMWFIVNVKILITAALIFFFQVSFLVKSNIKQSVMQKQLRALRLTNKYREQGADNKNPC